MQKEQILKRLDEGTWLSTVECVRDFHILRVGARIWDLKQEGYDIEERKAEGKSYSEHRLRPARKIELPPAFEIKPDISSLFFRSIRRYAPTHRGYAVGG